MKLQIYKNAETRETWIGFIEWGEWIVFLPADQSKPTLVPMPTNEIVTADKDHGWIIGDPVNIGGKSWTPVLLADGASTPILMDTETLKLNDDGAPGETDGQ